MGNSVRMHAPVMSSGNLLIFPSKQRIAQDLDYLAASLHARHSRMAEGERLDSLCHIRSLSELFHTLYPESGLTDIMDFQRLLVSELIIELAGFRPYLSGPGADLIDWMMVRFQIENVKIVLRICLKQAVPQGFERHCVPLPKELALNFQKLAEAQSLDDFIKLLPKGFVKDTMILASETYSNHEQPFFVEAMLDSAYFQELIKRTLQLSGKDKELIKPLIAHEIDMFHLMLIVRGNFFYGIAPEMLKPLHIPGTQIPQRLFVRMLNDPDLHTSMSRIGKRVLDTLMFEHGTEGSTAIDAAQIEALAWSRFFYCAGSAFRKSHMGLGAIVGYVGLRRVEVANLITISEGIRSGIASDVLRKRLIPRSSGEAMRV